MPGGRLTHEDRTRIAEGLAEGLSYTEIAARLDRPVSTVTREVARNGGPAGYLADAAEHATRGRRRRARGDAAADADGRGSEAVRELAEQFTESLTQTGLSRMTARVLTSLFLADGDGLTAAELVRRLGVSPASVSKAIGELEQQELVRRERDPRRRRDRYVIDADVWFRAWLESARQNAMLADLARRGAAVLGAGTPAGARLEDAGRFFDHTFRTMIDAAEQWRATQPPHAAKPG
ncbi:MarR family transcriptional regulator [Nonomuraea terrae]|uniref:MarR family transcriptional regulator n=1 Tax=Nonomuraea terrae TaxID=2530383 RepID=A0A4R4YLR6_9ACTN|nr:MarR family transcriptional regulator [Nonomuraea terrae]TDD45958.1 MarR family transcriptional regulator [Nonomuraea terrae]